MLRIQDVCLDTSVIRNFIHFKNEYPESFRLIADKYNVRFKIAEIAWVEILDDLFNESIKISDWKNICFGINSFLYKECPIQEMGYNLSIEMKVHKEYKEKIEKYNFDYWRKCWLLLMDLNRKNDLKKRIFYYSNSGPASIKIYPQKIKYIIEDERNKWYKYFELVRKKVDENMSFHDIINIYKSEFEKEYNLEKASDLIHIISRYTYLHLQKLPYNPQSQKRKNDSIDFSFFQLLSKPCIFCTEDAKMKQLTIDSEAPNKDNIMNIEDILKYYNKSYASNK